jgi:hypothetical protein
MRVVRFRPLTAIAIGSILGPAPAWAQGSSFETVYFSQPNNQILRVVEFEQPNGPGSAETVVSRHGTNFRGLVVRQDNLIFVANHTHNGSILVCEPESGSCKPVLNLVDPIGLDISSSTGALIAVRDGDEVVELDPTGCAQTFDSPGCRPGGYQLDVARKRLRGIQDLADVKFARVSKS